MFRLILDTWLAHFHVQTAALDGETDLKTRLIPSACMGIASELLHRIKERLFYILIQLLYVYDFIW